VAVVALAGCGGGGGATGATVGGGAIKGPLDCSAQGSVIATGSRGKTATGSTPSAGSFTVDMTNLTFPVTVTVSGCMDTITGSTQEFDLSTMVMDSAQTTINATPISTLAVATAKAAKVGGGAITQADLNAATATVLNTFGLSTALPNPVTGIFKTAAEVTNLTLASEAVAEVLRRSATATPGGASTAKIMASFAADLADGSLDGAAPAGVTIPVPVATASGVYGNLMAKVFDEVAAGQLVVSQIDPLTGVVMNVLPSSAFSNAVAAMATATSGSAVTAASIHEATTPTSVNARSAGVPVIALTGANPMTIAQGSTFSDPGSTVTDNVDTGLTATVTGSVNTAAVGTYTLTYNVSDAAGNAATAVTRTVNVTDQTAPVIVLTGANPLTIAQGSTFSDPGSTVTDNVDTGLTATVTGAVNTAAVGTYTLTYNVSDAAGNAATTVTRIVNVTAPADTTPPVLSSTTQTFTTTVGTPLTLPTITATDAVSGAVSVVQTGTLPNFNVVGNYAVIYTATDAAGNAASITHTYIVNAAAPTVSLSIAPSSVVEGSGGGATNLNFTVTLSATSASAVSVTYTTSDGTALSASDYTATTATLTIAAGATTGTITVLVNADTTFEPNETLTLTLSAPTGATLGTATATGTITNDDWIYTSPAGTAMINAGFVYVPGGWDVNGDGVIEPGFWISKYQAAATATPAVIKANLIDYLAGTAANNYADGMQVYNPVTKQFDQTLCVDGTDVTPGVTPTGCRHNNYFKTGNAAIAINRVKFVNNAVPLVMESAVEAMAAVADSPIAGGVSISLPSELQMMQIVQLLINNPASWTNGVVNAGGTLWRGNSNGASALSAIDANGAGTGTATDTTENATFDVNRRTWLLTNGVMANDSAVPATYCKATNADASVDGSLESVNAATEALCTVWDMAGNVWEWTRGLIAANATTSSTGVRVGGDRFINGASGPQEYSNVTLQANAPAWWLPTLSGGGATLTSLQNVGIYYDGFPQSGMWDDINLGYGTFSYVSGFAPVNRGGGWIRGADAGLGTADLLFSAGNRLSYIGFRAAAL